MRLTPDRLSLLVSHGLTDSEAKVYLALLDQPTLTAGAIAKVAHVPRSHMYKVLSDLHGKGLIDILLDGKVRAYRGRPLTEFLAAEAVRLRERVGELELVMRTLALAFAPPPFEVSSAPPGDVRLAVGRKAVARAIDDLLASAVSSTVIACSEGGQERLARHLSYWIGQARREAVSVEFILPNRATGRVDLPGATLRRFVVPRGVLSVCVDEKRMIMVHPVPDSADLRSGRDLAIQTDDEAFAAAHLQLLREASEPATQLEAILRSDPQTRRS